MVCGVAAAEDTSGDMRVAGTRKSTTGAADEEMISTRGWLSLALQRIDAVDASSADSIVASSAAGTYDERATATSKNPEGRVEPSSSSCTAAAAEHLSTVSDTLTASTETTAGLTARPPVSLPFPSSGDALNTQRRSRPLPSNPIPSIVRLILPLLLLLLLLLPSLLPGGASATTDGATDTADVGSTMASCSGEEVASLRPLFDTDADMQAVTARSVTCEHSRPPPLLLLLLLRLLLLMPLLPSPCTHDAAAAAAAAGTSHSMLHPSTNRPLALQPSPTKHVRADEFTNPAP